MIEIVFFYAVALGFGIYQIWSVNREIKKDKAAKTATDERPSGTGPGHAEGEHELDDR